MLAAAPVLDGNGGGPARGMMLREISAYVDRRHHRAAVNVVKGAMTRVRRHRR